jgi:protein-L-isoaspartate(D-aspartate) O-methyltransferase
MDYAIARRNMVESQVRPSQVSDPLVLQAMAEIPREIFLPKALQGIAYIDDDVPMGNGRYMMEPMVFARLIQAAEVQADDVVLLIGCATGYPAAVLARLASTVVAVESDADLIARANRGLSELEIDTVAILEGKPEEGLPSQELFDVIFFDGAVATIPDGITERLAENGRLVAVVAGERVGRGTLVTRRDGVLGHRELFDAQIPYLSGFEPKSTFVF